MHSKEQEIEKLRRHISQLESSESRLSGEFERQLREKDGQVKKLLRMLKPGDGKGDHDEIAEAYKIQLFSSKKEVERLRRCISEIKASEKNLIHSEELAGREVKIKKLLSLLKSREEENRKLSEQLDDRIITERDYAGKIKDALEKKERSDRNLFESLKEDLDRKNEEAERLRALAFSQERVVKQLNNQVIEYKKRISRFETFLEEKELMMDKLERNFSQQLKNKDYEIGKLSGETSKQVGRKDLKLQEEIVKLKTKLEAKEEGLSELAESFANLKEKNRILGRRLEERQKLFVESENTYNRLVHSLREQHERRIKEIIHRSTHQEIILRTELDKLKAEQNGKEAEVAEKQKEIDDTLLQFAETSKKLLAIKGLEGFSDLDISAAQLKEKEDYLKKKGAELASLLEEAAEKVSEANRKEAEIAKREEMLLKEQEAVNNELAILKSAGISIGMDRRYLKEKIEEYAAPRAVEQPRAFREESLPEMPEIVEEKPADELEAVEAPALTAVSEKEEKADVLGILRKQPSGIAKAEKPLPKKNGMVFRQAETKARLLPKPPSRIMKARIERPKLKEALIKQAERQDAFPEESGYGEVEEIKSIIGIGLQHGDSLERIEESLISSGYSKKNIEKAVQEAKG